MFVVVLFSPVDATGGDSYGSLLTAQALIRQHTIQLDAYRDYFQLENGSLHYTVEEIDGHLYNSFPLGAPVVSLPVVALTAAVGLEIRDIDRPLQKVLAALSAAVLVLILYTIART
jgi:hypothetical protein